MEAFYEDIRTVHITSALLSGSIFLVRSLAHNLLAAGWAMAFALRLVVWTIDTTLLTAAFMLMTITSQIPFADSWLTAKVLLLALYVILASTAFRASSKQTRLAATGAAAVIFAMVYSIARAHDPLGVFA
jgi:uncharacterized membrane protein SirB2